MEDEMLMEEKSKVTQEQKEVLYGRVEELKYSIAALLAENDMFERFISRLDPKDLVPQPPGEGPGPAGASQLEGGVTQLEKFNLKNQALKVQEKKLQQQLQQKKETGKAEYEVENKSVKDIFQAYNEQRIEKNLDELQVNNLKVQRVLSSHKEMLQSVTWESTELSNDITKRKQMLAKIEEEIQHAEEERLKAEALNQHLRRQMADYQAPEIIEYMHIKDKHKKLRQSIHTWERKVGIAEMALKTHTKAWNKQRATLTPANSAEAGARSGEHQIPVKLPYIAEHST
eukprot:superscaffoldBa00003994_g18084